MKLDIGCSHYKKPGFIGVDILPGKDVDIVCSVENLIFAFPPGSVDEVYSRYMLEHVDGYFRALSEIYRVCKPGAKVTFILPHFSNHDYHGDPTHKRAFSLSSFNFIDSTRANGCDREYLTGVDFRIMSVKFSWWGDHFRCKKGWKRIVVGTLNSTINWLANLNPFLCERIWCHWVGGFYSVEFNLERK